jgi:IS605 OrfB family transposase
MRLKLKINEQIRTTSIRIAEWEAKNRILSYVLSYKHFENMLLILIQQNYDLSKKGKAANDFKYLSTYQVMRAVIAGTNGGKNKEKADYIKEKYKENQLMQNLIQTGKELKIHNLAMIISRVKSNYKSFFTKIKKMNCTVSPPKPKKLSKLTRFSIPLDVNSWTFKVENQLGINLSNQMFYIAINHEKLKEIVGDLENIQSIQIHLSNGEIYLKVSYRYEFHKTDNNDFESQEVRELKERLANWKQQREENPELAQDGEVIQLVIKTEEALERALARSKQEHAREQQGKEVEKKTIKEAGIDVGIENLASIFIADTQTKSLILAGNIFKHYNAQFNRFIARLNSTIADLRNTIQKVKDELKENRLTALMKFRSFLYEKRNRYFYDQFHKASKRILEYLHKHSVTDLYISKNLASLKNDGNCHLSPCARQNFIQIPFIKLLQYIEYKAFEFGIRVHVVDEAYTSKTSSISGDVVVVQKKSKHNKPFLTNDFQGSRVKRGLFKDSVLAKVFNADLNAAINIVKVGTHKSFHWVKDFLFKLCNPIKLSCDWELVCFLQTDTIIG